jgi:hypothetical protein
LIGASDGKFHRRRRSIAELEPINLHCGGRRCGITSKYDPISMS